MSAKADAGTRAQWAGTRRLFSRPPGASGRRGCPDVVTLTKGNPGCATAGLHAATRTNVPWLQANARPSLPDRRPSQGSASPESVRDVPAGGTPATTGSGRTTRRGGSRGWLARAAGVATLPEGVRGRGHARGLPPTTGPRARRRQFREPGKEIPRRGGRVQDAPSGTRRRRPGSRFPLGHLTLALPPAARGTWAESAGLGDGAGAGLPTDRSARPSRPRLRTLPHHGARACPCARRPRPPRLSYGNQSPARLSGSNVRLLGAHWGRARRRRPSEAPEEFGAPVQYACVAARLAGQPLAQGGLVLLGEAAAAQLQLLQAGGDLVPEARAQRALDSTACRGEAGASFRELLPAG